MADRTEACDLAGEGGVGAIITGSPPHPMDFAFMGCGEDIVVYSYRNNVLKVDNA